MKIHGITMERNTQLVLTLIHLDFTPTPRLATTPSRNLEFNFGDKQYLGLFPSERRLLATIAVKKAET